MSSPLKDLNNAFHNHGWLRTTQLLTRTCVICIQIEQRMEQNAVTELTLNNQHLVYNEHPLPTEYKTTDV